MYFSLHTVLQSINEPNESIISWHEDCKSSVLELPLPPNNSGTSPQYQIKPNHFLQLEFLKKKMMNKYQSQYNFWYLLCQSPSLHIFGHPRPCRENSMI